MSPSTCPVCTSASPRVVDSIDFGTLIDGYRDSGLADRIERLFEQRSGTLEMCACSGCGLKWYADAPAGDGPFYEALQQHGWYYQDVKPEFAFAAARIEAGARVLEVGCGRAAFAEHLPQSAVYRGLEFNDRAVSAAREAGRDVEIRSIEDVARERPGHYDVVCHFQVLEHVEDPAAFMRDCAAALAPGGLMIVAVPAEDSFVGLAESAWLNMPPHHLTRWSDSALECAFRRAGVEPIEWWHEAVADYHRDWQRQVLVQAGWHSLFDREPRLVAGAVATRVTRAAERIAWLGELLQRKGLAAHPQGDRGHTLGLVGRKPLRAN